MHKKRSCLDVVRIYESGINIVFLQGKTCSLLQLIAGEPQLSISADMFESVNKKTLIHPLYKVVFSIVKGLPEELRLNSDG